jgi:hypothetical protein
MSYSHRATFHVNGALIDTVTWDFTIYGGYHPERMGRLDKPVANLLEGRNTLFLRYENQLSYDEMYVFWYEVFYERSLRALQGELDFFAPDTVETAQFTLADLPSGTIFLLDVTDHERPVLLTGFERSGTDVLFEDDLDGTVRHYRAVAHAALRRPGLTRAYPPSLRDETPPPHMVIIYHSRFRDAALRLRDHRATDLPYADQPVVRAVDIDDVYSNFSGGLKDPIAIRNYIKFLYDTYTDGGEPLLRYVLLFGNGTYDPRDLLGRGVDYVPFYMDIFPNEWEAIENESFLALLDDSVDELPDIAIGRLPVVSPAEADIVSQRIVAYESSPEHATWKNKVIMIADDEFSKTTDFDFTFIFDAEEMCSYTESRVLPRYLDIKKIYLRQYPFFGNVKPAAKADLLKEWNEGALVVNYAGHGSPFQLADEKIFLKDDIYGLTNGVRAPLFLVFSCTVGDMESPYSHLRSIGQDILSLPQGGCIAVIAGVAPTYATQNDLLNVEMFRALFGSEDSTATEPVGTALQLAKIHFPAGGRNSDKYTLIGDPALTLALPRYRVEHEETIIDTMLTGNRYRVAGAVMRGNDVMTSFHGTAQVSVLEAELVEAERVTWKYYPDTLLVVNIPGKELFRGSVDITAGRFDTRFVVPRRCRTGQTARVRSYVSSLASDGVGAVDSLLIMPAPPDSMRENLEAPLVKMFFAGQANRVKAGAQLIAEISDPDGIAILENDPQSSIFLEFDRSGFPVYVTEYFNYDHGSSTKGRVEYPLHSDISPGPHEVILRAFDNLGAAASDTLEFEVVEEGIYTVSDVYNFPNPFSAGTNFMFQLSSRGNVQLRVYTVSGVEVWERRMPGEEGYNSIYWEGRDFTGDRLGNGTYLYILDVVFTGSYNRTERVTGKVVLLK